MKDYYRNTPKGRAEIPNCSCIYTLLDKNGKEVYNGETNNLNVRIKEHHYDKTKSFKFIIIKKRK